MSMNEHDAECAAFGDLRGKCDTCTSEFLNWQIDGLMSMFGIGPDDLTDPEVNE